MASVKIFLNSCLFTLSKRRLVWAGLNGLYFGSILVAALLAQFQNPPPPVGEPLEVPVIFSVEAVGFPALVVNIFVWNLFVSAFLVVTLAGLVFFGLSMASLVMRAVIWGSLVSQLLTPQFLFVLPTLVLEGEGYVLASVAGIVLGLSWLKPSVVYGEESLTRVGSLRKAFREAALLYVMVAFLLFVAALIEAMAITRLT